MTEHPSDTLARLEELLCRLPPEGPIPAPIRDEIIAVSARRLRRMAARMLDSNPSLHRWEETDDVLQNAAIRLRRALETFRPASVRAFLWLAARTIRRELIELWRRHFGPEGHAARHDSPDAGGPNGADPGPAPADAGSPEREGPERAMSVRDIVRRLPAEHRRAVELMFFEGLTREEAATRIGVSVRTVQRWWRQARQILLAGGIEELPGDLRELADLVFVNGLPEDRVRELLGLDPREFRRRVLAAKWTLAEAIGAA